MATLTYTINAVDHASATFRKIALSTDKLNADLDELGRKTATARVKLAGDKEATLAIDKLDFKMAKLAQKVAEGKIGVEGQARALLEIRRLELAMDKLNTKRAKIHIDTSQLSKLAFFQPSAMGAALTLLPTLIPLAAQATVAVGAVGISFGAAALGAGAFGLVAKSVLTSVGENAKKLQELNMRLNAATTKAQKQAVEQQIKTLTGSWTAGYRALIGKYQDFHTQWQHISQTIAVPALNVWLGTLTKGLRFLKPLIKPIADVFKFWGITLNTYFTTPSIARRIKDMAAAFGNFAAQNLYQIGQFIKDIAVGVFNLGKDLAANGANFSSAGEWLARMGDGFLAWSKSDKARRDVRGFMKFIHDEGPVVKGILKDLGKALPGIFAGATTVGTLELQALGTFLNLVASLPPGWQKPVTEFAGAMLLLSKIGVVKVGIKLVGLDKLAALASASLPSAGGPLAAAGAAMVAGFVLEIRKDLKHDIPGLGHDIASATTGLGGFIGPAASGLADLFVSHFQKPARRIFHTAWHDIASSFDTFRHNMSSSFDTFRHDISSSFAADRHLIASVWDTIWRNTVTRARHGVSDVMGWFGNLRHDIADRFDTIRHGIATVWDTIWRNTVTRVRNGVSDVLHWIGSLPGKIKGYFFGASHWLTSFGRNVIMGFWDGMTVIWHKVTGWISSLAGWIRAHKGPVAFDRNLLRPAGEALMKGLHLGLISGFGGVSGFIGGLAGTIGGLISRGISGLFGSPGMGVSPNGPVQQYAKRLLAAYGWGGQFGALNALIMGESGWNPLIVNQSSGAYGIPQALPGSKMASAGADWRTNPFTQLRWMFGYLRSVYGSPANAYNAWVHRSPHWYGSGLTGGIFNRPTLIGVGERGPERVDVSPAGSQRREGPLVNIENFNPVERADVDLLAHRLAFLDS